jgi:hypothetical protein
MAIMINPIHYDFNPDGTIVRDDKETQLRNKMFNEFERGVINRVKHKLKEKYWMYIPQELMHNANIIVAGGCFASLMRGETPHDIDVFILDNERAKSLVKMHINSIKQKNPSSDLIKEGNMNYMDNESVEYTAFDVITKIQFITTKYKTREDLIKDFDMMHCCVSYVPYDDRLYITREVFDTIMKKEIRSNQKGVMEFVKPYRVNKMMDRGWSIGRN